MGGEEGPPRGEEIITEAAVQRVVSELVDEKPGRDTISFCVFIGPLASRVGSYSLSIRAKYRFVVVDDVLRHLIN